MVRITRRGITPDIETDVSRFLLKEIKSIKTKEGLDAFLNMLLTNDEQIMVKKRAAIKIFVSKGARTNDIKRIIDVSKVTISTVRRGLKPLQRTKRKTIKGSKRKIRLPRYKGRGFIDF
ncbi:MAG: Trp family transcriptional regulator [bacterium]|nr:Trp family transcriptional regulator [bacterium]